MIIYLVGQIISFILYINIFVQAQKQLDKDALIVSLIGSLLSWIMLFILIIHYINQLKQLWIK